jgi:hypothetical protein
MSMLGFNDFFRELAKVLTQLLAHGNHGAAPTVEYKHSFVVRNLVTNLSPLLTSLPQLGSFALACLRKGCRSFLPLGSR